MQNRSWISRSKLLFAVLIVILLITSLTLGLYFGLSEKENISNSPEDEPFSTSFKHAAVVTNGRECAAIGKDILIRGGSVADAAIATLLCEGVACFQSMGIGGGFLLTIYDRKKNIIETLNAREVAPLAAHKDMYKRNATLSSVGGLAVAVPGEIKGYESLYNRYGGKLPWKELFEPTIKLCREGILITNYTGKILKSKEKRILNEPSLREIFVDPKTNRVWKAGDKMKRLKLAETLETIALEGAQALYTGKIAQDLVDDIKAFNGIIELADLEKYEPKWGHPISFNFTGKSGEIYKMFSSPLPGSGSVLKVIMNILNNMSGDFLPHELSDNLTWHRIVESFKHGYGIRTHLGDSDFVPNMNELIENVTSQNYINQLRLKIHDKYTINDPAYYGADFEQVEDHGTANIGLIAPNGDAIVATGTINLILGAFIRSVKTGIILNDEMDDFSNPWADNSFGLKPSPANFIMPQKRPLSSMCPSIVLDENGDVQLLIGAAGGSKITTSVALVTIRNLIYKQPIVEALCAERLHHQLYPMKIYMEYGFSEELIKSLLLKQHKISLSNPNDGFAAVTAISRENNSFVPFPDIRRNGSVAGF